MTQEVLTKIDQEIIKQSKFQRNHSANSYNSGHIDGMILALELVRDWITKGQR